MDRPHRGSHGCVNLVVLEPLLLLGHAFGFLPKEDFACDSEAILCLKDISDLKVLGLDGGRR